MKKKTIAIVPAFNEQATIGHVVKNLRRYVHRVIVIMMQVGIKQNVSQKIKQLY